MEARSKLVGSGGSCVESSVFVEVDGVAECSLEGLQRLLQEHQSSMYVYYV